MIQAAFAILFVKSSARRAHPATPRTNPAATVTAPTHTEVE